MKPTFKEGRVTLVVTPTDMRSGYKRLAALSLQFFNIDVSKGKDYVVFVARDGRCAKIIFADDKGTTLLTRRLHQGRFQQLLTRVGEQASEPLTIRELERYLDGRAIQVTRKTLLSD